VVETKDEAHLATLSDSEVERRRDELAFDARHDPSLREDLAEVEAELALRRANEEREEAATREQVRREEKEAARRAAREQRHRVKVEREASARLAEVAAEGEALLGELADKLREVLDAIDARSQARVALGSPADAHRARKSLVHRTFHILGLIPPFTSETNSIDRQLGARGTLPVLLGVHHVTGGEA
jgi:hypothetical protein